MNFILWVIVGGLLGSMTALIFASSKGMVFGNAFISMIGSAIFGLISTRMLPDAPVTKWDFQVFSLSAFIWAIFGGAVFILLFNWVF